jgi:hypothetical protein
MSVSDQTIPAILERRYGVPPRRTLLAAAGIVVVIAAAWYFVLRDPLGGKTDALHRGRPTFSLLYDASVIHRAPPSHAGELLRLRAHQGPLVTATTVRPFTLPPYRGDVAGILPIYAENQLRSLSGAVAGFQLTADNRARVHKAPGYEIGFTFTVGTGRIGEGTDLYVVDPDATHPRTGLVVSYRLTKVPGRQPKRRRKVAKQMR